MTEASDVLTSVKEYYGRTLQSTGDLKTSACTACKPPPATVRSALGKVPAEVKNKFYGCGNPIPAGIDGLRVLDLGCGSGRDCYVAALMAGRDGHVTGVDMTDAQLGTAISCRDAFALANPTAAPLRFVQGYIEDIRGAGIADGSVDLIISNCVVNLSPNKPAVIEGAFKALAVGGEFHFSDVYADRRLPEQVRKHELLWGECIAGAMYVNDFIALCRRVGFAEPRELERAPIAIQETNLQSVVGNAQFYSITYRLFKLPENLNELACEDYGQVAYYLGTLSGYPHRYVLDDHHSFDTGRPVLVCGNTAAMLQDTYLKAHFRVVGDRSVHYGEFPCGPPSATADSTSAPASCGGGMGCC